MIERHVDIATPDGAMTTFLVHPERDGPHPVILFYMDAFGIREELRSMARRYAAAGYYVALPNLYYRSGIFEPGPVPFWDGTGTPPWHPVVDARKQIDIPRVMSDTAALLDHVAGDPAAKGPMGVIGYCMSGQFAINAAASFPEQFAAAACFFGTALITDRPDSPHRVAKNGRARFYFACAEFDHWAPLDQMAALADGLADAGVDAEVEIYPGASHAFAFPERQTYDLVAAERHWERAFALFRNRLG